MKNSSLFSPNNEQAACIVKAASCTSLPALYSLDVTAGENTPVLRRKTHVPYLNNPFHFWFSFSGLTSGYPQTPVGNGHSLDKMLKTATYFCFSKLFSLTCTVWISISVQRFRGCEPEWWFRPRGHLPPLTCLHWADHDNKMFTACASFCPGYEKKRPSSDWT